MLIKGVLAVLQMLVQLLELVEAPALRGKQAALLLRALRLHLADVYLQDGSGRGTVLLPLDDFLGGGNRVLVNLAVNLYLKINKFLLLMLFIIAAEISGLLQLLRGG
jgi:hypothetical protein